MPHFLFCHKKSNSPSGKGDNTYSGISYMNSMSQTALHCAAMYTSLLLSSTGRVVARTAGMVRELGAGTAVCSAHLASQGQGQNQNCWISVLGRSLSITPLKLTSSYLVIRPNALSTITAEILSFTPPVSTFIDITANTVKEDLLDSQVTRAALAVSQSWETLLLFTTSSARSCTRKSFHTRGPNT